MGNMSAGIIAVRKLASMLVSYGPDDLAETHQVKLAHLFALVNDVNGLVSINTDQLLK